MSVTVDWDNKLIKVPVSFLIPIGPSLYTLDINQLRLKLKDLEDDVDGITFKDTHRHNTEVVLSGVTYARIFEIINGYKIEFETIAQPYVVNCTGANHNLAEVTLFTGNVSLIVNNSAGLIAVTSSNNAAEGNKFSPINFVLG